MGGPENGGKTQAFEALRASEELHRATLSNISDAVFMADDTGKFTFVCPNVDVIFGYTPDEVFAHERRPVGAGCRGNNEPRWKTSRNLVGFLV